MRTPSLSTRLRRAGFIDTQRAHNLLEASPERMDEWGVWLDDFAYCADPDQALLALLRLADTCADNPDHSALVARTLATVDTRRRLLALCGLSTAFVNHLCAHPTDLAILTTTTPLFPVSHPDYTPYTSLEDEHRSAREALDMHGDIDNAISTLRRHYYRRIMALAAADMTSDNPAGVVDVVSAALSDMVGGALEAALTIARKHIPGATNVDMAVIAMGKTGAREVNYVSDVDVIYVARPHNDAVSEDEAIRIATKMAVFLSKAVSGPAREAALWPLDANLRPEGSDGPLVRTLESHVEYYRRWAKNWEFQALLKARPVAGDMALGSDYVAATRPFVWNAASSDNFVEDARDMRKRVENTLTKDEERQLKLGKGGLRDVEFTVQLLQLVHGRTDETLRVTGTLEAIAALKDGGYISRPDAELLDADYRFMRLLEHRLQLQGLRRSHRVPSDEGELRRIARSLNIPSIKNARDLDEAWQQVRREVRGRHRDIYYRPLLPLAARLSPDDISLNEDAAYARLAAIGYRDPAGAIRHINALTHGVSRAAAISRQLLPVMLGWFADAPDPDAGLLAFRVLFDKAGTNSYFMRSLRDGGASAERLCHVLATSRFLATHIPDMPEAVSWLSDTRDLVPPSRSELENELAAMLGRRSNPAEIANAGRYLRRRELVRAALAQSLALASGEQSRYAVSLAADIAIHAALQGALRDVYGTREADADFIVVALGRFGGQEMSYASDADIMIVYRPHSTHDSEHAGQDALAVASRLVRLLTDITSEPPLAVDMGLRPEGKDGPVARSLDSYREYYERWADMWEKQALLRARVCAGSERLARDFITLIDPIRYKAEGLSDAERRSVRMMKARIEGERIPRGVSPERHIKLGRGGLTDIEWTIQLLQLDYAGAHSALQVQGTLEALRGAQECALVAYEDAQCLIEAWERASQMRDMNFLVSGKESAKVVDVLPSAASELGRLAYMQGIDVSERHSVEEEYLRATRRARTIVERIFYGSN